ncbi:MAG TPA: hypothetical protein VJR89_22905 [Polyangiales bacterium]|nr:hypothetical protein [Polyangiales bacterium]
MQRRVLYAVAFVGMLVASGCELIADFDRSKIPGNEMNKDASLPPPTPEEDDAGASDAAVEDAG